MINYKIHTPEGVKDYLPLEIAFKNKIETQIQNVFKNYGFCPVKSPTFEFVEVFEESGSLDTRQMYKLLDKDGSVLALRPDMTPAIARISASFYQKEDIPLRFYYIDNTFRNNKNYQGKLREFTQAGVELIGINSRDADAEIVAVAINSLIASGLRDFRIDIGQVQFFNGLLEEAGFDSNICDIIKNNVNKKDFVAVNNIVSKFNINENIKKIFEELPVLLGGKDIISKVKKLITNKKSINALLELEKIYNILGDYQLQNFVSFDLGLTGNFEYYTGLILRGYSCDTGYSIVDGGRYDNLLKNYGCNYPSVGVAIKINELMSAIEKQGIENESQFADTLLVYTDSGRKVALSAADQMRRTGLSIENSILGDDLEKNKEYARHKNMGGILYFIDSKKVKVINLISNKESELNIEDILKKE